MPVLQPGGVVPAGGVASQAFVTALSLLKPQNYDQFIEAYGAQSYTQILEMLGNKQVVQATEFGHYESRGKRHFAVQTTGAPAETAAFSDADTTIEAGEGVTVTITAASHFPNTSGGESPIRVGEVYEIAATGILVKCVAVNKATAGAHTMTIVPLQSTYVLNSTNLPSGSWLLGRGASLAGEASTKVDSQAELVSRYSNTTTMIREDFEITDKAMMQELWVSFDGEAKYTRKGAKEAVNRFLNNKEFTLLFGVQATNSRAGDNGTSGLIPTIESRGQTHQWNSDSVFDIEDFHSISRLVDFNGGASEYHFLMDSYLRSKIDDALFAKYQNGAIQWAAVGGSNDVAVKYGFDSIKVDGITYHLKKFLGFNAEAVYGVAPATEKYKNFGILAPMKSNRDARTGDNIPSLQVVYNEIEPGKELKVWETGGLAKVPTSDKLNLVISHACSAGLRTFAANQFVVVKP